MTTHYMAIDQYGHTLHGLTHPRRDIAAYHGVTSQALHKQYTDTVRGPMHTGYIIHNHWYTLYTVTLMERPA